ncbi:lymphocyte cytosolic protein 2 isoform X1 [Falco biarmicus]|uniref:lymphocyte cytosolic protein 2 isoform X1 n=1 Tax=Falco cherrug TaxID=345164 RepID=UPI0006790B1B|nr:lymphocyte cytosolic protein 2 isoform X1 [Falco cherrug]XP_037253745.1 lymphocyte cytosolic protein 2 isoform X1 [Falco rusticolus]XP_056204857.1 lymphocyte cytosolic protein 2 isoform X1 [Falco biarmicus]
MDLRNVPYRSDVVTWNPDELADYFRMLKYKDCEKVVRKHSINGQRFLNMSENDIQKFPKLRVPIVSKLSQEINRNEGRLSFLPKWAQTQKCPENPAALPPASIPSSTIHQRGYSQEDDDWSSFDEDDDYESPDDDQEKEEADYESPTEEPEEAEHDSDGYEPPPSNNDEAHHNVIFPAKSLTNNTDYIDRPPTTRSSHQQPPVPPQRPGPSPVPASFGGRGASLPAFPPPPSNDLSRERNTKPLKPPAPSIDRSTKPPLDRLAPPFERESPVSGRKPGFPEKPLTSQLRSLGEQLAMMPKPPVPPSDRYERGNPPPLRKQTPLKQGWPPHKKCEEEEDAAPQRPVPQISLPPYSSNTFPCKSVKPLPKPGSNSMPGAESARNLPSSGSLPPRLHIGNNSRSPSRGTGDVRPPLPIPSRHTVHQINMEGEEDSLNDEWYVAYVSRTEAEAALRKINKDGTFLVRDSSRKTATHPYVLMVLYRDKVYNIQIRYQEQNHVYLLGTGLKGKEDFSSVADIIDYFQRTPLLLIDGKDRGSRNQCMLKYAAGHI